MKTAIVAITKNGSSLAGRLAKRLPGGADVFVPKRFIAPGGTGTRPLKDDLAASVASLFKRYNGIVFIMAAGVVVRMAAPLLKDKLTDPAVVVMDEKGRYAISLLSGHAGGANGLAKAIAEAIGAEAVITTASDVQGTLAVDTLAEKLGCAIEDMDAAKKVTAAIVNEERVAAYSHIGIDTVRGAAVSTPLNIRFYKSVEDLARHSHDACIIISPFVLPKGIIQKLAGPVAFLRPRTLHVGMGCNRGTSAEELGELFSGTFKKYGLSPLSVKEIATIAEKRDEAGLLEFARRNNFRIKYLGRARLLKGKTPSGPSEAVFRNMGVYGVCEPAALLSAGAETLIAPKRKSKNATIAVAEAASR